MNIFFNIPAFSILLSMFCAIIMLAMPARVSEIIFRIEIGLQILASLALLFYFAGGNNAFTYSMGHFGSPFGNNRACRADGFGNGDAKASAYAVRIFRTGSVFV